MTRSRHTYGRPFRSATEGMGRRKRVEIDGHKFASAIEARRYDQLCVLARASEIRDLTVHPCYRLVVDGTTVCRYTADFSYFDRRAQRVVIEDVKPRGHQTELSKLKIKLFNAIHKGDMQVTIVEM